MLRQSTIADARTTVLLAAHFEKLKQTAMAMRQRFGVRQRGYFTPSEDEQTRHLLVSYWQARTALFELATALQARTEPGKQVDRHIFLIAYTAACVLVDAARFLREVFGDHAAVLAKLNEPEPAFGIPGLVYNTVQRSLTSPRHAWQIYQANQYFGQHRRYLSDAAGEDEWFRRLWAIIERLRHRLAVSTSDYAAARLAVRAHQIENMARTAGHAIMYALQEMAGRVMSTLNLAPALPLHIDVAVCRLLEPGDVLVTRREHAVTNYFLPGYWPHAALFLGDAKSLDRMQMSPQERLSKWSATLADDEEAEPGRVLEALKDGVMIRSLRSPLSCDAVAVIRPRLAPDDIARALARGLSHAGKPYDFDFDFARSDRLVCTEVVYRSYDGLTGIQFELTRRAGRMTFAADDLLKIALAHRYFEPVAVYAGSHRQDLAIGGAAAELLRQTMGEGGNEQ